MKDEIEALQVSTDPDGYKVTSAATTALGSALGGSADGRIAYDTTKNIVVRDADNSGSPIWRDLALSRIRKGSTGSRPVAGLVSGSANLYYNTDTSTFQLDTGGVWVDIGPGGGSGGDGTLTEDIVSSMTSGSTHSVTHPSVPLTGAGSGEIRFSVLATKLGSSTESFYVFPGESIQNLNTGGAGWVQDSGVYGHFSAAVDPNVVVGVTVNVAGTAYTIASITGGGTAPSSVELDSAAATGAISYIRASTGTPYDNYLYISYYWDGGAIIKYAATPTMTYARNNDISPTTPWENLGKFKGISGSVSGGVYRAAFSLDGGSTWISFDGSAWVTITLANLEAAGLQFSTGYAKDSLGISLPVDDGTSSPAEGWGTLRTAIEAAGAGLNLCVAIGIRTPTLSTPAGITSLTIDWAEKDTVHPHTLSEFIVSRTAATTALFSCNTSSARSDVHCQVWTA
jgi:hypothetical protein